MGINIDLMPKHVADEMVSIEKAHDKATKHISQQLKILKDLRFKLTYKMANKTKPMSRTWIFEVYLYRMLDCMGMTAGFILDVTDLGLWMVLARVFRLRRRYGITRQSVSGVWRWLNVR